MSDLLIITGPTASGKTQRALERAQEIGGEIINADSMQLYCHLPILTACPDYKTKALVPHHLYEVCDTDIGSMGWWVRQATNHIKDIISRKHKPILVGGTGLYIQGLIKGMSPIPEIPGEIRQQARHKALEMGREGRFFAYVSQVDPLIMEVLKPQDTQRLTRALEVKLATGRSLVEWQKEPPPPFPFTFDIEVLNPDKAVLHQQINDRFIKMIQSGAIEEVKALHNSNVPLDSPIHRAVGVREITAYLEGALSYDLMIQKAQQATRQYAKRQRTWIRRAYPEGFRKDLSSSFDVELNRRSFT